MKAQFSLFKIISVNTVHERPFIDLIHEYNGLITDVDLYKVEQQNPVLYSLYKDQLKIIVDNFSFRGKNKKIKETLGTLLTVNTLKLLDDKELPLSIKQLFLSRLPNVARILEQMYSRSSNSLLKAKDGHSHFSPYKETALNLKKELIKDKDQAGITFQGRSESLFKWCRQELSETRNPLIQTFLKEPILDELTKVELLRQFDTLNDISNLLILFIGACDDLADTIQDKKITDKVSQIPYVNSEEKEKLRIEIQDYRDGIFKSYFDNVLEIWEDSLVQLKDLFGEEYFNDHVNSKFLEIFQTIVDSLSYSVHLNIRPHDSEVTISSIYEKLAPNIMVRCFRHLEHALVQKQIEEFNSSRPEDDEMQIILLPGESDLDILDSIIRKSQSNAASSNAAATMSRELKENDLSSPFPFAINDIYNLKLQTEISETSFVVKFEEYLKQKDYRNGFFATYFEERPGKDFDYLSLLVLRRAILAHVYSELDRFKRNGCCPTDSDYNIATIGEESLKMVKQSSNENLLGGNLLEKYKRHIDLIDSFSDDLTLQTNVYVDFFEKWESEIREMKISAQDIQNPILKEETQNYINSWEEFLCMYLLFKRTFDGTI